MTTFETGDLHLAAFLRCQGHELLGLAPGPRGQLFLFRDTEQREKDVLAYINGTAHVPAQPFVAILRELKALIHNR